MATTVAPPPAPKGRRPRVNERRLRNEILEDRLRTPLSVREAAEVLDVSRPTVLAWLNAGLLPEGPSSSPTKRLLDTEGVYRVRQVLSVIKRTAPRRQGGEWFRRLVEAMYWTGRPAEQDSLIQSLDQADRGEVAPFEDDVLDVARRQRLEARVTPEEKEFFQRAAEAAGQSLTDFIRTQLHRAAHEIELKLRVTLLSAADSHRVADALINPPEPTEALRRAAQRYRERTTPLGPV